MRLAILASALFFIAVLTALTVNTLVRNGPDILVAASLLVLALFGFGIVGALRHPPEE
jgi:hypothetical protein